MGMGHCYLAGCPSDWAPVPSLRLLLLSPTESWIGNQPKSGGGAGPIMWVELTRLLCSPSYL